MTAVSIAFVSGSAAIAAVVLGRKFGRSEENDGFFAGYSIYLVLILAAHAFRVVVMPRLAQAAAAGRLGSELGGYAATFGLVAIPALAASTFAADTLADLVAGSLPAESRAEAADALRWLVPAAFAQFYAALAASALAALDDYGVAAAGFAGGAVAGLALFLVLVSEHGPVALAWGLAAGGAIALAAPLIALVLHRDALGGDGVALRPGARVRELAEGASLPLAMQALFVIAVRLAGDLGVGEVTSFSYAYLIASFFVAVTATSLALVSSVPLTRSGLAEGRAAFHVVSATWLSLTIVAGAAGVFALAGERVFRALLGSAFEGDAGTELGRLVVYFTPWMAAAVGVSVTFPLLFVAGRSRWLPAVALAAVAVHVPLEWAAREAFGLAGLAAGLGITTAAVLTALLAALSRETLVRAARGLASPMLVNGALATASFAVLAALLAPLPAALLGLAVYVGLLAAVRPPGLRRAWAYVRTLA